MFAACHSFAFPSLIPVHHALVASLGIPPADRFQIVTAHPAEAFHFDRSFLGLQRSGHPVVVEISLRAGRPEERKRELYRLIATRLEAVGVPPADVLIVLHENTAADWSFGNGLAQYAAGEPAVTIPASTTP